MRTPRICFAAAVLAFMPGRAAGQEETSALGLISRLQGQVFVEHGSARSAARLAELLFPGDRITTVAGQAVFLFCPDSSSFTVLERTTVEIAAAGVKTLKGAAPAKSPSKCLLPRIALGRESMERFGGLRARNEAPLTLYLGGQVTTERPVFQWEAVSGAQSYSVTLRDANQDTVVWETSTDKTSAAYPESSPALGNIQYQWEVAALAGRTTLARGTAVLEVKPNAALSGAPAAPEDRLLRAIGLENEGYYAEAAFHYRELRDANPDDPRLTRHLAWLYWNAGLLVAANNELRRLAEAPGK